MEGIIHLRRLAEQGASSSCRSVQEDLSVCGTGFWGASKQDLYSVCDAHGINHTDGQLQRYKTTHIVVPFTLQDMEFCQSYARHVLISDKINKAIDWQIPIVSIDFLFHKIGSTCRSCGTLIPGILKSVLDPAHNYRCPADCIPVSSTVYEFVEDTPSKYCSRNEESSTSGQSIQHKDDVEKEDTSSALQGSPDATWIHTKPAIGCMKPKNIYSTVSGHQHSSGLESGGGYACGYNVTTQIQCSESVPGSQTPGIEAFDEADLRHFASIKVTPYTPYMSSSEDETSEELVPCTYIHQEENEVPLADCFIPGDLLPRAPKGNNVRKRHNITSRKPGMIAFTESMTFRHLDYMHLDVRHKSAVEIIEKGTKVIVNPLHFYKILGQDWMMEFNRYFKAKDVDIPDVSNGLELYRCTQVEGCLVHAVTKGKIKVHRLPRKKGPIMPMESSGPQNHPPYYYRYDYDTETGRVLD